MITPQEYIENKYPIIPCYKNERRPIGKEWEEKETGKLERFSPGDNIGLHLINYIDLDIDNPVCHWVVQFTEENQTLKVIYYLKVMQNIKNSQCISHLRLGIRNSEKQKQY